ncbi:MAG: hypothetical protein IJH83_07770 [Coriobacteriales bacterium]|nr:hypothetical protein [Coriobacteriales bacterium]
MNTRFIDPQTGLNAFCADIPQGWTAQGAIIPNNVMDNWVTVTGAATSADGGKKLLYETMCTYRFVLSNPNQIGADEPVFLAQAGRLFWRYHKADEFADEVAAQIAEAGQEVVLQERSTLPGRAGTQWLSPETYQFFLQGDQQNMMRYNASTAGLASMQMQGLELTAALSVYRVPSQMGDRGILVATTVKGIQVYQTNSMIARFGGVPAETYVEWKPTFWTMLTDWPISQEDRDAFMTFVDSADLDPNVMQVSQYYSNQFNMQLDTMKRVNDERWNRVSSFAKQQSEDLDRWRADNWNSRRESSGAGGESIDDHVQRMRHESMAGVNTFEREDGTTYEFSTQADRVFENDFDPRVQVGTEGPGPDYVPDGWTEGHRKF